MKQSKASVILRISIILVLGLFLSMANAFAQTNIAMGKTITASSYTQVYVATNANDGNLSSYWEGAPNTYPNILTVDLGADSAISSVGIKLNPDPAWGTRSQTLTVLGKTAAASSYSVLVASASYSFVGGTSVVSIPVSASVRFVQLSFTANTGASGAQVAEFEVIGSAGPVTETPYGGVNRSISNGSTIQAEDYDLGGSGVAYSDNSTGNTGGAYRSDDVDIENCSDANGGYDVGWIADGEWLNYLVNATAGTYTITARIASNGSNVGDLQLSLGGSVLGTFSVNATGGWQSYADVTLSNITIASGTNKILQLKAVNGGDFNINYLKFSTATVPVSYALTVSSGSGSGSYVAGTPVAIVAAAAPTGQVFNVWTGGTAANFANSAAASTTYTTIAAAETIVATYKPTTPTTYALTVTNGSGSGSYASGAVVSIVAATPPAGQVFSSWSGNTAGSFGNASSASTTFTMPSSAQSIIANYTVIQTGNDLASGKPAVASSTAYSFVASNATDGSVATYWEGAAGSYPNTLTVSLGLDANITSIVLKLNPDTAWSTRTQTFSVLGHALGSTSFTTLLASANYSFNPSTGNTVTIPVTGKVSDVRLNFTANTGSSAGQVAEFQVIGTPSPNPDLQVIGLSWAPSAPVETDNITLTAAITNSGSASAGASSVNFYLDTTLVGSAPSPTLAIGASANVSVTIPGQNANSYTAKAVVDETATLAELSYSNNSFSAGSPLIVAQVPSSDLVGTVSWTPSNPSAGNSVVFSVTLLNQGISASAGGAHAISLVLKDLAGNTIQNFSGSYSGSLAAGASATVTMGSWTALNGSYTLTSTVAVDANELAVKQANNVATTSFYSGRGANMPYTKIEAESAAVVTTGTKLTPNFKMGDFAGEASGRSAVKLDTNGQYVEFTLTSPANALVMRNAIADGTNGTVTVYVNGVNKGKMAVSADFSYVYATPTTLGRLGYDNSGSVAYWLYEDAHLLMDTVYPIGSKIRIQKDSGDVPWIYVDLLQTENVAPAATNPDPSKYVEVSASKSIDTALNEFRQDSSKLGIFIPAGDWTISSKIFLYGRATEIIGAGPWHTRLRAPTDQSNNDVGFNISAAANGTTIKNLSAWGNYKYRVDGPGKFIDGNGMQHVTIDNVWIEHFVCMYWGVGSSYNTFKNCRIMNTFADGINMTNGSSYNLIDNCDARGNGDDAFALFSAVDAGGSYNVGNVYSNDTATCTRRAANFAVYGGSDNVYKNLYGADTLTYPGITISSWSFGYNTLGFGDMDCVFDGITLDRTGGDFWTSVGADDKINDYQNFGAIWLFAGDRPFKNIVVKNVDINNPVYFGLMFQGEATKDLPMENIRIENVNINNPTRYGIKLVVKAEQNQVPVRGGASFTNVKVNNPGVQAIYGQSGCPNFIVTKIGTGNNW